MTQQQPSDRIEIERLPLSALVPDRRNARTHSDRQVRQIAASIAGFGFVNPILIDEDNRIIAGHGRHAAARQLGLDEVPVIRLAHLTPPRKRALALADNKLAENAGWDVQLLAQELTYLSQVEVDFEVAVAGFSAAEIDVFIEGDAPDDNDPGDDADPPPAPMPPAATVVRPGDLWMLGQHRLLCGDARAATDVERLLAGAPAHTVFTDPPGPVPSDGGGGGGAGANHFVCVDWRHLRELLRAGRPVYGMDMDPGRVETAIRRWQDHTGRSATHADTGRTLAELRLARRDNEATVHAE